GVVIAKPEDAIIIGLGGVLAESPHDVRTGLVGIGDLGDAADGDLGGQIEPVTDFLVTELVEVKLLEGTGLKGATTEPIAGIVAPLQSVFEDLGLVGCRFQLDVGDKLHGSSRDSSVSFFKGRDGDSSVA